MLNFFKKKEEIPARSDTDIVAAATGKLLSAAELSDAMFREEMMGQTIGILPEEGIICSPANGTLEVMFPTGHAFAVRRPDHEGLLVHIGVDTVNLNGRGFKILKNQGDPVKAGEPIVNVDLHVLKNAGLDSTVMLVVTEPASEGQKETYVSDTSVIRGQKINL